MSKDGNDRFWGFVAIFFGLIFVMNISNCSKSSDDFILINGTIDSAYQTTKRTKKRTSYRFKLQNHPYKKVTFSNYHLYDMKSRVNYKELLQSGNKIRAHVLIKELWGAMPASIHSLEINGEQIVEFESRWYPDMKFILIGIVFILGGGWMIFSD